MSTTYTEVIEQFTTQISQIHTGRVSTALVENIAVQAYDSTMRLQELAGISTPEPQTILIEPWDKSVVKEIEIALRGSEHDFNPIPDGDSIRLNFPPLTEEKRKEEVKNMHAKAEEARIGIRKVREETLKGYKAEKEAGDLSEDDYFRMEKEVQEEVDGHTGAIKAMADKKEAELMSI